MKLDSTLQRVHIYGVPYTTPEIWNREGMQLQLP
jgi:hypothetical protein